jgi:rod shape-determining protein MreC
VQVDDDVAVGDTIISSGWGERYPEGLPVGEVQSIAVDSAAFFLSVTVKPFVRFETLEEVFILQPQSGNDMETEQ